MPNWSGAGGGKNDFSATQLLQDTAGVAAGQPAQTGRGGCAQEVRPFFRSPLSSRPGARPICPKFATKFADWNFQAESATGFFRTVSGPGIGD